jgi:DDE_Tnp_1-associated
MRKFKQVFRRLPEPLAANARHDLLEVLAIALAATLCGAESCSDMADFGQSKEELLRLFLRLEHGIPSHDTFSRVFRLLEPEAFEKAFRRFIMSPAAIGASRTSCIGCSMFILPRTAIAREKAMLPRTSPPCAGSPSTSCELTRTALLSGAKSSAPAGTMPFSLAYSVICDSPALAPKACRPPPMDEMTGTKKACGRDIY